MFKRKTMVSLALALSVMVSGCGLLEPGLTEYSVPEETGNTREVTESGLEADLNQEHEKLELDSGFLARMGFDSSAFNSAANEVEAGMSETAKEAAVAESKYEYWSTVISKIDMDAMEADFESIKAQLISATEALAAEKEESFEEYAASYSMSTDDLYNFLDEAAQELASGKTIYAISAELKANTE